MVTRRKIAFFVPELPALDSGVLHSQVLAVARHLALSGAEVVFCGIESNTERANQAHLEILDRYGIRAHIGTCGLSLTGVPGLLLRCWTCYWSSRRLLQDFAPTHIYARSSIGSSCAARLANDVDAISIYDVRGAAAEEVGLRRGKKGIRYRLVAAYERRQMLSAGRLSCVSENLRKHISMSIRREAIVIPSCVDLHRMFLDGPARLGVRSRLNISGEDVVFCYAGGLSRWQRVHDIIRVFGELAEHSDEYHFLFVTRETDRLAEMLAETNLLESTRCHQISCAQHEMRAYLSAADVAIIMRDNVATNNVASPIKIGEYLSCGLPVVSTVGIGDFGERLSRAGVCLLLDETRDLVPQIVAFIQRPLLADRRLLAPRVAAELFGIDAYATEYDVLYS